MRELRNFIKDQDHGLMKEIHFKKYGVTLAYNPPDLMVCRYTRDTCVNEQTFQKVASDYTRFYYFDLVYQTGGKELAYGLSNSYADYSELLKRMSFRMGEYVYATTGKDTVRLADFTVSNAYGLADRTWMLISLSNVILKERDSFEMHVRDIRGIEPERTISIKTSDLKRAPGILFCKK